MTDSVLFIAVFVACVVEAIEATTIVLAAGTARNWRSALTGTLAAIVALAIIVAVLGPAVSLLPLWLLRIVVGGLLLIFGLQWVTKALLRWGGFKALHDETRIYQERLAEARAEREGHPTGHDWHGFTLAFKGVLLEGLEVVYIVLTFGANQHNVGLATIAAAAAVVLVTALAFAIRAPLSRVPENAMKLVVGILLTSFGLFWGAEGAGASWPGGDAALLVVVPAVAVFAVGLGLLLRSGRARRQAAAAPEASRAEAADPARVAPTPTADMPVSPAQVGEAMADGESAGESGPDSGSGSGASGEAAVPTPIGPRMLRGLKAFGLFWYDFVIGDDWRIAAGIVIALVVAALVSQASGASWLVVVLAVLILLPVSVGSALRQVVVRQPVG